jgi:hypothetical protein
MNTKRMQSLLNSGFDVAEAYRLEAVLSNDENGIPRSKSDQDFINSCRQQIIEKVKDK